MSVVAIVEPLARAVVAVATAAVPKVMAVVAVAMAMTMVMPLAMVVPVAMAAPLALMVPSVVVGATVVAAAPPAAELTLPSSDRCSWSPMGRPAVGHKAGAAE